MASCWHCGEPLPARGVVRATLAAGERAFCCGGCAAAAEWIHGAGFDAFYRIGTGSGARVAAAQPDFSAWDAPAFLDRHAPAQAGMREMTVLVEGMRCPACAWLIEKVLAREAGVAQVMVDVPGASLHLRWREAQVQPSQWLASLSRLGYRAHLPGAGPDPVLERESRRTALKRLAVAGLGAMQAMMTSEALYFGAEAMDPATRDFFRWITFLVATPVVYYAGWPFLRGAWQQLRWRRPGMDLLVATSVLLAWGASTIETLRGGPHVYFDAAVMFVLFLLATREIEGAVRRRTLAAAALLARRQPATARVIEAGGDRTVDAASLAPGARVRVASGEVLPADGTLDSADGAFDESLLSGESRPILRHAGDPVLAGSLCSAAAIEFTVTRAGPDTTLAQLARLALRAGASRPRIAALADRVAAGFVLVMLGLAALTAVAWLAIAPERALPAALAVLAVSCPCALALAVPAALAAASAGLARDGVLVLDADALPMLAQCDTLVMDKTGTLTEGRRTLRQALAADGGDPAPWLAIAAALERHSRHPIARAFDTIPTPLTAEAVVEHAGRGIEGRVEGRHWRLGLPAHAGAGADDGDVIALGDGQRIAATFEFADATRPGALEACRRLRADGMALELLSGDAPAAVAALARDAGIDNWRARQDPAQKIARVRALQAAGHRVAMLGDGINDAAVLAGADVSLAVAEGAALALAHADVVLHGGPAKLPALLAMARGTRRVMRQNLAWALAYNLALVPAAALGLIPPWLAALGMSVSSLAVTLNALRLARVPASAGVRAPRRLLAGRSP